MILLKFKMYKKNFNSKNYLLWLCVALIASFIWLFVAKKVHNPYGKEIYVLGVDAHKEIKATENLVKNGVMDYGTRDAIFRVPEAHDYAFRMPGFIVLFLPLYLLFGQHLALTLIIILQVLLYSLSAYLLGKTALILFKKNWTFYFCFFSYLACSFVSQYNFGFNREGLSTSLLVIAVYLVCDWYIRKKLYTLFIYSVLITWVIFLRPFFLPVYLFFNVLILFNSRKDGLLNILKVTTAVFLFFFITLSIWTIRNYRLTKQIIVLESDWDFFNSFNFENTFQDFNIAIGGNMTYWENNTSGTWFFPQKILNEWGLKVPSDNVIPDWIFSKDLTRDTLVKARAFFWQSIETSDSKEKQRLLVESQVILKKFMSDIARKYPLKFYFTDRIKSLWDYVYKPQGLSLRGLLYPYNVVMTFVDNFIKYLVFFIGFLGSFYFLFKIKDEILLWFPLSVIGFLYIFLALFLQDPEYRRIAGAFPFLLVIATGVILKIVSFKKPLKLSILFLGLIILCLLAVNQTINLINW